MLRIGWKIFFERQEAMDSATHPRSRADIQRRRRRWFNYRWRVVMGTLVRCGLRTNTCERSTEQSSSWTRICYCSVHGSMSLKQYIYEGCTYNVNDCSYIYGEFDVHCRCVVSSSRTQCKRLIIPCFLLSFHSHCIASFIVSNPSMISIGYQGDVLYLVVYFAPPFISPLCCRKRRKKLLVIPT